MGSRSNIMVKSGKETVVFYSHYLGPDIYKVAHAALSVNDRWTDFQYLNAIVARQLFKKHDPELNGTLGVGISQKVHDNSYPVLVLDVDTQKVYLEGKTTVQFSFTEFVDKGVSILEN